ncbi:MAG: YIP1 family protein [Pseudomonadota bacterium]
MAATRDIVATYGGPAKVVRKLLGQGAHEPRALMFLMLGCLLVFIAQMPRLAREAHLTESDLSMMMGGALMGWIFIAPLALYTIALLSHFIARALGRRQSAYAARLALFWALLASTPLMLLWGLTAGFVGPGIQLDIVGALWFGIFMWFWLGGLWGVGRGAE